MDIKKYKLEQQLAELQKKQDNILNKFKKLGIDEEKLSKNNPALTDAITFFENLTSFIEDYDVKAKKELLKTIKNPRDIFDVLAFFCNLDSKYLFNSEGKMWYKYQYLHNYLWSPINDAELKKELNDTIENFFPKEISNQLTKQTFDALLDLLKTKLLINLMQAKTDDLCVFIDKVFNTKTFKRITNLEKKGHQKYITSYSPIKWEPKEDNTLQAEESWENNPIRKWLASKMPNQEQLDVFRAVCNVVFHSNRRYNLEFFLEIHGPGQTGKSTAVRLMESLIDRSLITSSNLKDLEQSMYEKAKIANKHLILLNEQKHFVGDSPFLKAATGGDLLNINQKYKDPYDIRNYGVIVITTNNTLIFDSSASAIMRRRISIKFDQTHDTDDANPNLLTFDTNNHVDAQCDFYPHLPGFLHWVITLDKETTIKTIRQYLAKSKNNPDNYHLIWWLKNHTCPFKDGEILLHNNDLGPGLYLQYKEYCEKEGLKPISLQNFQSNVEKDFKSIFGYDITSFKLGRATGFKGLTYQINLGDHFENWRNAWLNEYGPNFFGENTTFRYTDKNLFYYGVGNTEIDTSIIKLDEHVADLIKKAPKGIYSLIGNPAKKATKFDVDYNEKNIPGAGQLPKIKEDYYITLTKKEHKEIFIQFLNTFKGEKDYELTTNELYPLYVKFMHDHKYKPQSTKNGIKNQTVKTWNKHFHVKIETAINIGSGRLPGIKGIKPKEKNE